MPQRNIRIIFINWVLFVAGILPSTLTHYSAKLVMPSGTPLTTLPLFMGGIADIAASLSATILLDIIILWTGKKYSWLKGLCTGGVLWVIHTAFIPSIAPRVIDTIPPSMVLASFILSILWGFVTAIILWYLPEPRLNCAK